MANHKSVNPMFLSALDILTGALGVFIVLNFLNTRMNGTGPHTPTPPVAQQTEEKKEKEKTQPYKPTPQRRPQAEQRPAPPQKPAPVVAEKPQPKPETTAPEPKPAPAEPLPPTPPQDPVAVDLMKQTKGDVTILLQQEGVAKQSVEFMLKQGSQVWKPGRAGKYQTDDFQYEKSLNYFYQASIKPGRYEVWVRVKKRTNASGQQPFALYGKIVQPGYRSITHNFGAFATSSTEWVLAGTLTILHNALNYQSVLPAATAVKPTDDAAPASPTSPAPATPAPVNAPRPEPKRSGKWGR